MKQISLAVAASIVLSFGLSPPASADEPALTQSTLLDRIVIEDLMVSYYTVLTAEDRHEIGSYFTEDAVLVANDIVLDGRATIQDLYDHSRDPRIPPGKTYHMLLGNPRISVAGDKATMDAIWTGVISDSVKAAPRVLEQGTEHTEFVKRNGRWLIAKRTIKTEGGMPDRIVRQE